VARRAIIIDCDPGVDDAVALLLAFASPDRLDLRAITTVAGNVTIDLATRNALRVREVAGRPDVPVHSGAAAPLRRPLATAEHVHGAGGLGGVELPHLSARPAPGHAADALAALLLAAEHPVTLAMLGPQTNIAMALERAPEIRRMVAEIVFMGGSAGAGNVTPHAEFNMHVDPDAAAAVLASRIPSTMVGLDVTRQARMTEHRLARIAALATPSARLAASILEPYVAGGRLEGEALHDPCVIAYLLEPGLFRGRPARVSVECVDQERLGKTTVSAPEGTHSLVRFLYAVDVEGFFDLLAERLGRT
jgi:purine nucleosidase